VAGTLSISGIAPYGLAGLDWMAGMGEDNVVEFGAALEGESKLRPLLDKLRQDLKDADAAGIVASLDSLLPEVDKAVLTEEFGEDMAASFHEALRYGVDGWMDDDLAFIHPWGFEFPEISGPVMIWQGGLDLMVPFAHGQALASEIPGAAVHLEVAEGHLSIGLGSFVPMLDELVSAANIDEP
jgi:pimeloyl-ACP methyl ester carboxylesterase